MAAWYGTGKAAVVFILLVTGWWQVAHAADAVPGEELKQRGLLSVVDVGALPDDDADDTVAIQSAIYKARDEDLVRVPFIELCPNTWLVTPLGEAIRVEEKDQFVPKSIRERVDERARHVQGHHDDHADHDSQQDTDHAQNGSLCHESTLIRF